jgi:penicillin-binding protein 1A
MRSATVAIEDKRYWEHGALDWRGIGRAALNNLQAGGIRQGGSTISQQLAKNLYLQREASSRSLSRKLDEAWIAVQLQDKYTKAEILTAYLNTVFYGESAYGVEAAAHTFFDKTAKQLTLAQSALLAGLPQAPSAYNPFIHPAAATKRRSETLRAMRDLHWISAAAYAKALNAPLDLKRGSYGTPASSPFVFDQVRQELDARLPAKLKARGGLRVYSTVDQRLQFAGRRAIKDILKTPGDPSAALVSINVHNGNVLALATSDYGSKTNQFNLATAGHRSPGSTFKLFALVDALRRGADPQKVFYPSGYVSFPENDPVCPQPGGWSPSNADGEGGGYMSLDSATVHSVNVVYAQLMRDLGPKQVAATAHLLGIRSKLPLHCSMVLGADDVTPLELTSAYATIAAGGVYHRPRTIRRVEGADGNIVASKQFRVQSRRVVSDGVAYEATQILKGVVTSGTGTRARLDDGRPQAGKTGTAENYGNAWFCGYTPDIATCVWVGYRSSNKPLENIEGFGAVYGGTIPAAIWKDFMTTATKRLPPKDWPEPKHPMVYKPFDATTTVGYNPRATPPTPPAGPDKPKKPANKVPATPPTKVVIAPQG